MEFGGLFVRVPAPPLLAQRYQLERRIAQGGMAEVWLATDTLLNRNVAVKVLKAILAADPVVAERFRREAVAVAGLNHPNIVAIYDTVDERGRQAVVMQYVPGKSLRQLLDEDGSLSPEATIRIGISVAAALEVAHGAGLVHRDVKPGNILVTPEGRVLLTDFGIAKAASGTESDLTSDNVMMGTAKYLSPEQVRGRRLDGRADLYSLGLVLYECLTGRVPFLGENDAATALARLQRDPTPIVRLRPTLPPGLPELVHRLLARNPDERPASGALVQNQLQRIRAAADDPTSPTPVPGTVSPRPGLPITGQVPRTPPPRSGGGPRPTTSTPSSGAARHATPRSGPLRTPSSPSGSSRPPLPRDPTPSAGLRIAGRPARQFQHRRGPSLVVVGGLLLAAVVLVVVLVSSLGGSSGNASTGDTDPATGAAAATTLGDATGPVKVASIHSYDPNGDDPQENEGQVPNLTDGSTATSWSTLCYANKYMGGHVGVGVILELTAASKGTLDVTFGATPWTADVYAADQLPDKLVGWGQPVDTAYTTKDVANHTFDLGPTAHRYVLLLLRELAPDSGCSADNHYRGRIAELAFHAA